MELICTRDRCFEVSIDSVERVFIFICWCHLKCGQQFLFLDCVATEIGSINVVSIPVLPSQPMLSTIIASTGWAWLFSGFALEFIVVRLSYNAGDAINLDDCICSSSAVQTSASEGDLLATRGIARGHIYGANHR